MKRRYLMSVALAALLAGCGTPAGADGNLVDEWAMLPAATVPVPVAGTCYRKGVEVRTTDMRTPVAYGDRIARCYVLVDSKKPISKSLKGNGTAKI